MSTVADRLHSLIEEIGFAIVDQNKALGQPAGIPTTLAVLANDPLALLFRFRINPEGTTTEPVLEILKDVPDDRATVTFEDGYAWLTLYDLSQITNTSLRLLVERVADTLCSTDFAVGPGCLRCGATDGAQVMYVDGRPTRLCTSCESQLNRPTIAATLSLPAVAAFVAVGWAALWTVIDLVLEKWQINAIQINTLTALLVAGLLAGVGKVLGGPLGNALRQSIAIRRAPKLMSLLFVVGATVCGEIGYIALALLRLVGMFDLGVAARFLGEVVATYSLLWIVSKLAFVAAIWVFSVLSASRRTAVGLNV